jgi:hypothetical protein
VSYLKFFSSKLTTSLLLTPHVLDHAIHHLLTARSLLTCTDLGTKATGPNGATEIGLEQEDFEYLEKRYPALAALLSL